MTRISFPRNLDSALDKADTLLVLAPRTRLESDWTPNALPPVFEEKVRRILEARPGTGTYNSVEDGKPARLILGILPEKVSRHASPTRLEAVTTCVRKAGLDGSAVVVAALDEEEHLDGVLGGVVRALPLYDRTQKSQGPKRLAFFATDGAGVAVSVSKTSRELADARRWAARLVDTPTAELDAAVFVKEARALVKGLDRVKTSTIVGDALLDAKLGGIHAVGRAAMTAPRLLIMEYRPPKPRRTVALVGKGIVYDTGGLSLKSTAGMCSMKGDMGGAAAVAGAFRVLAASKPKDRIYALCCLAENAIGPDSFRNDDILDMHSGLTVEINNTDAEGRLLLGDGVSYAARKLKAEVVIDAATLTGAQLIATGTRHAGIVSNREGLERVTIAAGRRSGDLTWPLPFAPEWYQNEFASKVADMKNSVKNRMNAQSSCAAQFVHRHLSDTDAAWLHIDLAGPSWRDGRGSGYGVALIAEVVRSLQADDLRE